MNIKNNPLKQCVILSGKGGTGKTSLSASLMHLSSQNVEGVYVDADVDAANLALVTKAVPQENHRFGGSKIAHISPDACISCGLCYDVCRYDAIREPGLNNSDYEVIDLLCDGCAACVHVCPESAIEMVQQEDGDWFHSITPYGHLFHAELFPAAENTGKLVTLVKQHAKLYAEDHHLPLMIVDGPPGIGCPVISASAGADLALLVAEPGVSGIHDLNRIIRTLEHFNIPIKICINKADLYPEGTRAIRSLAVSKGHQIIGEIPFDKSIPEAMVQALPITEFAPQSAASQAIKEIWIKLNHELFGEVVENA